MRGRGDPAVGETCGGHLQGVRVEVEQLDHRVRGRVDGAAEVPAGSGADVEVPATEVGVVVREQAFAGAAPDEGVAPRSTTVLYIDSSARLYGRRRPSPPV